MSSSVPVDPVAAQAAEVVVGIACYNNAGTIEALVRAIGQGIARSGHPGCVVLADGGSTDQTVDRARDAIGDACHVVVTSFSRQAADPLRAPYHGMAGRPQAIQAVLGQARERGAAACAFFTAGLTRFTPDWVPGLVDPVLADAYDYVSPVYQRAPHEGAITKSIVYPMFRALYGLRVRQPAAGEFGCSSKFLAAVLDGLTWEGDDAETGIDLWLAVAAATGPFRVCEAMLGRYGHEPGVEAPDLSATLAQVVGAMFADLEAHATMWQRVRGSAAVPVSGGAPADADRAAPLAPADIDRMREAYRLGFDALREVWAWIVQPRTILQLKKLAEVSPDRFRFGDELWAEIVYDFALAYRLRSMARDHLLGALTPLYLGWLAGFVLDVGTARPVEVEARLEQLCVAFEQKKPYLIAGWRWPERFRA